MGDVDSSALMILLSGKTRTASANTLFLMHNLKQRKDATLGLTLYEIDNLRNELAKLQAIGYQIIAAETGRSLAEVRDQQNKGVSLTAEEAKEFGIIYEVV